MHRSIGRERKQPVFIFISCDQADQFLTLNSVLVTFCFIVLLDIAYLLNCSGPMYKQCS